MNSVTKIVALALATGAFATIGAAGNALAHNGVWQGGYGHHFGYWYPHFYSGVCIGYSPCYWVTRTEGLVKVCPGLY